MIAFIYLLLFAIFFAYVKSDLCEICVCNYNHKNNEDFLGEIIDCSYKYKIFDVNKELPQTGHSLDLSSNNLTRIKPTSILTSKSLKVLLLINNQLTEINSDIFKLPELKRLDLSFNLLTFIDEDVFKSINKLEFLNLANNKFTTFSTLTFHHLRNLNEIVLDNNNLGPSLKNINIFNRQGFGLTHQIKVMSLSGINLDIIPENFFVDAYDIRNIDLSNNKINNIFELPYTLESLDLSDNLINEISSEDFSDVPALKSLKLNNLLINEIPDYVFFTLKGLKELELERNKNLTKFSSLAFGREVLDDADDFVLEKLSLKDSNLYSLNKSLAVPFGQLVTLDLQGNPWRCNCDLMWIKTLQITEEYYENLRCATPIKLQNSRIFKLDESYFRCSLIKHYTAMAIAIITFCVALSIVALWIFIFLPKQQFKSDVAGNLQSTSIGYQVLPLHATEFR